MVGGVLGVGAEIIVGKERVEFVVLVLGVYNYCCLGLVSFRDHGIVVGEF